MPYHNTPVFGTTGLGGKDGVYKGVFGPDDGARTALEALQRHQIKHIDTAQLYNMGESEKTLGRIDAASQFTIDTKWLMGWARKPWATAEQIQQSARVSLESLGTKQVDVFYLHCPDPQVAVEETLRGVNEVYQAGGFRRLGLSNFTAEQVQEVMAITEKNNWVKPSVYQGSYSAVARRPEDELFPLLRKYGLAFYAYSPIAGGFLTKDREFVASKQGRFGKDFGLRIYHKMYVRENFMALLDKWNEVAKEEGVSKAELAYRWINHHSRLDPRKGDAIVFGASSVQQLEQTAGYLQAGPLSDRAVAEINRLWPMVRDDSIMDNFQAVFGS